MTMAPPATDLLSQARALLEQDDSLCLVDWHARRSGADTYRVILQLRDDAGRRQELVVDDLVEVPSLAAHWPAAAWPQREAIERQSLRLTGEPPPTPLWTAARRAAEDEADGAEPEDDEADLWHRAVEPGRAMGRRLAVEVTLERRVVRQARVTPGATHSGFESLAVARLYAQLPSLAEGLNEQAPYAVGLSAILAVEALLGVTPTPRSRRLRMLLAEVARVAAHCAWLTGQAEEDDALYHEALATREAAAALFVDVTGVRWGTGVQRVGGIAGDLTAATPDRLATLTERVERLQVTTRRRLLDRRSWRRRFAGVAAIDAQTARRFAITGPTLRATGVDHDVRRLEPYLDYADVDFDVPIATAGDVVARVTVRLDEMTESLRIARQCLQGLPDGPVQVAAALSRQEPADGPVELIGHFQQWMEGHGHRPAPGHRYTPTESADGELALWLAADGTGKPSGVHLRSPSLFHARILEHLLTGVRLDEVTGVIASLNIVAPEMDR